MSDQKASGRLRRWIRERYEAHRKRYGWGAVIFLIGSLLVIVLDWWSRAEFILGKRSLVERIARGVRSTLGQINPWVWWVTVAVAAGVLITIYFYERQVRERLEQRLERWVERWGEDPQEVRQESSRIEVTRIELIEKTVTLPQMHSETIRCPPTHSWDGRWQEVTVLSGDRQPRIRPIHDGTAPGQRGITVQNYGHPVEPITVRVRGACRSQPISLD